MRSLFAASAALFALTSAAVPAAAAPAEGASPPERGLFLTLSGDQNTWIRGVLLRCAPQPSGHHPFAQEACAELGRAGGDLDRLPQDYRMCAKEYDPVTVGATGTFQGRPVAWHKTYGNACELVASTGHVFRF
ncbi:subtilase-type protease inhibitor [Streptomyces sp. PmtG]